MPNITHVKILIINFPNKEEQGHADFADLELDFIEKGGFWKLSTSIGDIFHFLVNQVPINCKSKH